MKVDMGADHGGFEMKQQLTVQRRGSGIGLGWVKSLNATKAGPPLWRNGNRCCHRIGVIGGNDDAV